MNEGFMKLTKEIESCLDREYKNSYKKGDVVGTVDYIVDDMFWIDSLTRLMSDKSSFYGTNLFASSVTIQVYYDDKRRPLYFDGKNIKCSGWYIYGIDYSRNSGLRTLSVSIQYDTKSYMNCLWDITNGFYELSEDCGKFDIKRLIKDLITGKLKAKGKKQ